MDIQLPEFRNGESFPIKMANWQQLGINYRIKSMTALFTSLATRYVSQRREGLRLTRLA